MTVPCYPKPSRQYSCMRYNWQVIGFGAQVDPVERRLKPKMGMPTDMPHG
jgi:hypothetical protein